MYSGPDTLERVGFPIRTSADQRSLASPRGFSQRATSFIASWRQGIHRTPLSRSHHASTARTQDQTAPHETSDRAIPTLSSYALPTLTNQSIFTCQRTPARPGHPFRGSHARRRSWKRASQQPARPNPPHSNTAGRSRTSRSRDVSRPSPYLLHDPRPLPDGMEATGFEPVTPCLQSRCSTS
jgi:hypothetical protein